MDNPTIISPGEEANALLRGERIDVQPNMDHQGFIKFVEEVKKSDELLGQFDEAQAIVLEAQSQRHAAMVQSLKQLEAQDTLLYCSDRL